MLRNEDVVDNDLELEVGICGAEDVVLGGAPGDEEDEGLELKADDMMADEGAVADDNGSELEAGRLEVAVNRPDDGTDEDTPKELGRADGGDELTTALKDDTAMLELLATAGDEEVMIVAREDELARMLA